MKLPEFNIARICIESKMIDFLQQIDYEFQKKHYLNGYVFWK